MKPWSPNIVDAYVELAAGSRITILHPFIVKICGETKGKKILDFGCGDGGLAIALAKAGARELVCVDHSPRMIEKVESNLRDNPLSVRRRFRVIQGDEKLLPYGGGFDIAICSLVLVMQPLVHAVNHIVRGMVQSLNAEGTLIVAVTHPCFRASKHRTFRNRLPAGFQYWKSGTSYSVVFSSAPRRKHVSIEDYHWTLSDYFGALKGAGALVGDMFELPDTKDIHREPAGDPAYLVIVARRCARV